MLTTTYVDLARGTSNTDFHALLELGDNRPRRLDLVGIVQFLLFMYPLYGRTFVEDIRFQATDPTGAPLELRFSEDRSGYDQQNEDRLWQTLVEGMNEVAPSPECTYGIGNSGGMDSRVVLFLAHQQGLKIAPYTLGDAPSDAAFIAGKTAQRLGLSNSVVPIERDFLQKYWRETLLKKPMHSLVYAWYLSGARALPPFERHLTGFNGDNMLGSHLSERLRGSGSCEETLSCICSHYQYVSPEVLMPLLSGAYRETVQHGFDDLRSEIRKSNHDRPENIFEEFNFKCRQLRFIKNSVNFDYCGRYEWASPFFTRGFMDFATTLTWEERLNRRLYSNTLRRYMPQLSDLRFERGPSSLADDRRPLRRFAKQWLWKNGPRAGIRMHRGNHKRVSAWMNESGALKFVEDCFLRPSAAFSELFDVGRIREQLECLFERRLHLLMALFTLERWLHENEDRIAI